MKIKVKRGYTLFIGPRIYRDGDIVEVTSEQISGQRWKIEKLGVKKAVKKVKAKSKDLPGIENRMMRKTRVNTK